MARFYREKPANCKGWMYSKVYNLYFHWNHQVYELCSIHDFEECDDDDFNECLREAEVYDADTMQPLWIE